MNAERLTSRQCNVCHQTKGINLLVPSKRYRGGYMPVCKDCRNEYWRERYSQSPEVRKQRRDAVRRSRLLSDYGITEDLYKKMVKEQGNRCKLCGTRSHGRNKRFRYWNVDHDHQTGSVRGLLCHSCNISIGKYETLIEKVGREALISYLST